MDEKAIMRGAGLASTARHQPCHVRYVADYRLLGIEHWVEDRGSDLKEGLGLMGRMEPTHFPAESMLQEQGKRRVARRLWILDPYCFSCEEW
jgi:hypothetical protein